MCMADKIEIELRREVKKKYYLTFKAHLPIIQRMTWKSGSWGEDAKKRSKKRLEYFKNYQQLRSGRIYKKRKRRREIDLKYGKKSEMKY